MKNLRSLFTAALILALAFMAAPARAADESPFKFEFHGFITGSMFLQDQQFFGGQGQGLLMGAPTPLNNAPYKGLGTAPAAGWTNGYANSSGTYLMGDVRQSRFILTTTGPKAFGATPKAYIEGDFLGGSGSALLWESWIPRLRMAYAELNWGNTQFQAGQFSAHLLLGQIPNSVAHIANPPTFGAGTVGWRTMGFRVLQTVPLEGWKLELALEAVHSRWGVDPAPGTTPASVGQGTASNLPQVDARVRGYGKSGDFDWNIYVAGSFESINLKGFGDINPAGVTLADGTVKTSVTPYVAEVGGLLKYSLVSLAFNFYTGSGTSQMAGALLQPGMVGDTAFWLQLGIQATPEFSIWGLFGNESLNKTDLANWNRTGRWVGYGALPNNGPYAAAAATDNPKSDNQLIGAQLRYQEAGYAFALEYYRFATKYLAIDTGAPNTSYNGQTTNATVVLLTAGYFF